MSPSHTTPAGGLKHIILRAVTATVLGCAVVSTQAPQLIFAEDNAPAIATAPGFCNTTAYEPLVEYMGTQLLFYQMDTGHLTMSANAQCPRYGLSLSKLYIADYVYRYGEPEEAPIATRMVETSDDEQAAAFFERYPDSISTIAREYGLAATHSEELWGNSVTSAYDIALFLSAKFAQDPNDPVLEAMRNMSPVAADGYQQNFGTATLHGVEGTKLGWSNDDGMHNSVSFGTDSHGHHFIAIACVFGDSVAATRAAQQYLAPMIAS
ncbi:MAG: hypothetical protein Q3962_08455 [Corynebacterium sp.]|nr:hypothetical protein [Corynebacterium sp.]